MDFGNTKVAFSDKTDGDLRMARILFQTIQNPKIIRLGKKLLAFAMAIHLPILWIVRLTVFKHFCGGRTIKECKKQIETLKKSNIGTILDYSVESSDKTDAYNANTKEIIATIESGSKEYGVPFAVFKLSALASNSLMEKIGRNAALTEKEEGDLVRVKGRIDRICAKARELEVPVLIDAEESWLQVAIDLWAEEMMRKYNTGRAWVYTTVQLYRNDKLGYLQELFIKAKDDNFKLGLKLVRGAYMEKEHDRAERLGYDSPVFREKLSTDQTFNKALEFCLDNLDWVYFVAGTHNEDSCKLLADEIKKRGLKRDDQRIYFSQLLGMSDHISYNLANEGFNVAKYVPYGPVKKVMPYLIRRAEENTSVSGQTSRELQLITRELKRRKEFRSRGN
ncbi:MAG: proline dehydrogenase family protein [Luteibaculum sp.]